jgi:hypothetical protein
VVHGTKLSIVFLLALTYLLLGGGVGMVLMVRHKAIRSHGNTPDPAPPAAGTHPETQSATMPPHSRD